MLPVLLKEGPATAARLPHERADRLSARSDGEVLAPLRTPAAGGPGWRP